MRLFYSQDPPDSGLSPGIIPETRTRELMSAMTRRLWPGVLASVLVGCGGGSSGGGLSSDSDSSPGGSSSSGAGGGTPPAAIPIPAVYVVETTDVIAGLAINETTGILTAIPGKPFPVAQDGTWAIAFDPKNPFAYATSTGGASINGYSVNSATVH
jgi:hypothetical protein